MVRKLPDPNTTADFVIYGSDGTRLIVQSKHRRRARVKVGDMIVSGDKASAAEVKTAVARSSEALNRLSRVIVEPGVRLSKRKDVPLFSIDPNNPGRVLRELNGRVDRGILENGAFKILDIVD
jgi:hypothetical protein